MSKLASTKMLENFRRPGGDRVPYSPPIRSSWACTSRTNSRTQNDRGPKQRVSFKMPQKLSCDMRCELHLVSVPFVSRHGARRPRSSPHSGRSVAEFKGHTVATLRTAGKSAVRLLRWLASDTTKAITALVNYKSQLKYSGTEILRTVVSGSTMSKRVLTF